MKVRLLIALALTLALGLLSRLFPLGLPLYDKSLGDVLYAVAAYLGLAVLLPRRSPAVVASLALAFCLAVESFKITGIPKQYAHLGIVRWMLGTSFSWHNLVCYLVGVAAVFGLDAGQFFGRPYHQQRGHSKEKVES
jgi:hypothetical protein